MPGEKDWVTPVAVVGGLGAVGLGTYFLLKKPPGFSPGDIVTAHFKFDYLGPHGTYVIQVSFGRAYPLDIFDHIEGMTWHEQVELPGSDTYELILDCPLPIGTTPKSYDAEALIRTPDMDLLDYLIKKVTKGAIIVREE